MTQKVIIVINNGIAELLQKNDDIEVEIRDYDVECSWDEDNAGCKLDKDGDRYQEMIFPAAKIKFSANGKSCFADATIKYINYYKCSDCDVEWSDQWDSMCDDRCPECDTPISPDKSEEIKDDFEIIS